MVSLGKIVQRRQLVHLRVELSALAPITLSTQLSKYASVIREPAPSGALVVRNRSGPVQVQTQQVHPVAIANDLRQSATAILTVLDPPP